MASNYVDLEDNVHLEPLVHYLTQDFEIMTKPKHIVERMKLDQSLKEITLKVWPIKPKAGVEWKP
tara:strand:- start:8 stop:202 length:195 start_codon:yes stop_codon:yes gene_type:complete